MAEKVQACVTEEENSQHLCVDRQTSALCSLTPRLTNAVLKHRACYKRFANKAPACRIGSRTRLPNYPAKRSSLEKEAHQATGCWMASSAPACVQAQVRGEEGGQVKGTCDYSCPLQRSIAALLKCFRKARTWKHTSAQTASPEKRPSIMKAHIGSNCPQELGKGSASPQSFSQSPKPVAGLKSRGRALPPPKHVPDSLNQAGSLESRGGALPPTSLSKSLPTTRLV